MIRIATRASLAALLLLTLAACDAAARERPRDLTGEVVAISDGDSFTMLVGRTQVKVRIHAIDAPERNQAFGTVSRRELANAIFRKKITVREVTRDPYGRVVGVVTRDGTDVGLQQVRSGLAWHYRHYAHEQSDGERRAYAAAEREARSMRRGLWSGKNPIPPWEFRRSNRRQ